MVKNTGFFVDWDGNTRRVEAPGAGYACEVVERGHIGVDVLDSDGCVMHEATYFATLEDVNAAGVTVNLVGSVMTAAEKRSYWRTKIGCTVKASNNRGAEAVGKLLAVVDGVWGYGGDAVALELDAKDDRDLNHWPAGMCVAHAS